MSRTLVAMSGGVDSSVAALMLRESGLDVVGVFMRNGVSSRAKAASKSCCSASDAKDAASVAERLGIPFYVVDYEKEFGTLIDHFVAEYRMGRTPNPCVLCNQDLKFGHLFKMAQAVGADAVATGHYARIEQGRLCKAVDLDKDQSYYLFGIARDTLPRVHFPLGSMTKAEVRAKAREASLWTAEKPESMEICFVTSGDYRDVVRARGGAGLAGPFLDESGRHLGTHQGVGLFTVGQRRGLPALGTKTYVKAIRPETGEVVLAERDGLLATTAAVRGVRWLVSDPAGPLTAEVKVRARSAPAKARLVPELDTVRIEFDEPVAAITPGQAAVFYDGDMVLGGGFLD